MARREVMRSSNANGAVTGGTGAAVWPSLEPLLHTPPGQVVNLTMVEGNGFRGMQLHIDTRGSGSGSAHRRQQEEDPEGSGLRGFHAPMQFKVREEVAGLDFGRQIMLPYYPLHLEQHADHGMVTYSQSQRGRVVQSAYHVATMGVGTSVRKCVILLLNTREDVEAVGEDPEGRLHHLPLLRQEAGQQHQSPRLLAPSHGCSWQDGKCHGLGPRAVCGYGAGSQPCTPLRLAVCHSGRRQLSGQSSTD